jgi:hypothetical protein
MHLKILLITIGIFLTIQGQAQNTAELLVDGIWGEINDRALTYRGKSALILIDFNTDFTFKSYVTTCTGDNVLQKGIWEIRNDTITFSVIKTKRYRDGSSRKGKILSTKDFGEIAYRIKELEGSSLILENIEESIVIRFERTEINYFPKE